MTDLSPPGSGTPAVQAGLAKRQRGHHRSVINKLQGLLSPRQQHAAAMARPGDAVEQTNGTPAPSPRTAPAFDTKFLKIRIVTWNMHDSLPKGDLEELLGRVPLYNVPLTDGGFPHLPNDGNHPYHLVVIAGQECPTPSGIPMGLGAGFKILDKDRDKTRDADRDSERSSSKIRDDGRQYEDLEAPPIGWTSIVEDWLSNGGCHSRTSSPTTADIGFPRPLIRQKSSKDGRKGPYQLLIKDRLMGIYLAVYIHRDLKQFVEGTSKSAVTAGLIGGRVGNKGGVGISLKIDGLTYLFLNAHLAAHEGKVHHRQANLAKIKSQLSVDDFLPSDDPRKTAEDLTDRFDFSFICGDLNFRLNVSRLHADWLIERGEYAQAFEFDQLHLLMKENTTFAGFHEAPIDFPPTFKYDVLRSVKRSKRSSSKRSQVGDHFAHITEVEEPERDTQDEDADEDVLSVVSSATGATSINSQPILPDIITSDLQELSPSSSTQATKANSTSKISIASASARKAKVKIMSLLSPSFVNTSDKLLKVKSSPDYLQSPTLTTPVTSIPTTPVTPRHPSSFLSALKKARPPPMILVNSPNTPPQSTVSSDIVVEKGVYDSSSKQRVPSWCDRILWKTTITPPLRPESDVFSHDPDSRPRNRMGQFFANAFRPTSSSRSDTGNSTATGSHASENAISSFGLSSFYSSFSPQENASPPSTLSRQPNTSTMFNSVSRRANTAYSPPPSAPLPIEPHSPRRATDTFDKSDRPHTATYHPKWRFLPSFFSPTLTLGPSQDQPPPPTFAKGTVKCLSYNTLDDRGMRRLEGRSDHRPVIGTYIVFV